jgi:uncharacterized protein
MNSSYRDFAKGLRLILVATLLFTALALRAQSVAELPAKATDYVSDFAHVLSPEAIARIDRICSQLDHSQANAQIAVVTVKTLNGDDAADWANQLENKWHIGKKGTDRGVLILLAVSDHKRRIDVGYGLEGILNDAKLGDIGREMVPYLRQNDFDEAVLLAVNQVGTVIADDAKVSLQEEDGSQTPQRAGPRRVHHGNPLGGFILLIILLVFFGGSWIFRLLFGWGLLSSIFGGRGGWGGGGWGGGSWGSGGGWGGGGGGGGGSGFGGFGGGDFGGGGAGGDW